MLKIQWGKDGMKGQKYNAEMGEMAGCCIRLAEESTLSDDAGSVKEGFKGDAWFSSVNAAVQAGLRGKRVVLHIKNNKSLFPKGFIEDALLGMPGGVHIVLRGTHHEIPLVALGYRYSTKTTLYFVFTKDASSMMKGSPYKMK